MLFVTTIISTGLTIGLANAEGRCEEKCEGILDYPELMRVFCLDAEVECGGCAYCLDIDSTDGQTDPTERLTESCLEGRAGEGGEGQAKFDIGTCVHLELTENGNCVSTKGEEYGSEADCYITVLGDFYLDVQEWEVEEVAFGDCSFDYLTLPNMHKFCNDVPHGQSVSSCEVMHWHTDYSGVADGWKICASSTEPEARWPTVAPLAPTEPPTDIPTEGPTEACIEDLPAGEGEAKFDIGHCDHLELTENGNCVRTKGEEYGDNHDCYIRVLGDFYLNVREWEVERDDMCSYDFLKLPNKTKFCSNAPNYQSVSTCQMMHWHTDSSTVKDGWEICASYKVPTESPTESPTERPSEPYVEASPAEGGDGGDAGLFAGIIVAVIIVILGLSALLYSYCRGALCFNDNTEKSGNANAGATEV